MKYIDLSNIIETSTPVYPGDPEVSLIQNKFLSEDEYNAFYFSSGLHAGTHIDCPMHLTDDKRTIAEFKLEFFCGDGFLIDARGEEEIDFKEGYNDKIKKGDVVLIYTGMDLNYGKDSYYNEHPAVTMRLAEFLVSREIKILGIDMPSPDYPPFPVHKLLFENGIFIVENLTNLKELLDKEEFEFFAQPLKISAEASFTRAFARCRK